MGYRSGSIRRVDLRRWIRRVSLDSGRLLGDGEADASGRLHRQRHARSRPSRLRPLQESLRRPRPASPRRRPAGTGLQPHQRRLRGRGGRSRPSLQSQEQGASQAGILDLKRAAGRRGGPLMGKEEERRRRERRRRRRKTKKRKRRRRKQRRRRREERKDERGLLPLRKGKEEER